MEKILRVYIINELSPKKDNYHKTQDVSTNAKTCIQKGEEKEAKAYWSRPPQENNLGHLKS